MAKLEGHQNGALDPTEKEERAYHLSMNGQLGLRRFLSGQVLRALLRQHHPLGLQPQAPQVQQQPPQLGRHGLQPQPHPRGQHGRDQ